FASVRSYTLIKALRKIIKYQETFKWTPMEPRGWMRNLSGGFRRLHRVFRQVAILVRAYTGRKAASVRKLRSSQPIIMSIFPNTISPPILHGRALGFWVGILATAG